MLLLAAVAPRHPAPSAGQIYIQKRYAELHHAFTGLNADEVSKWMKANATPKFYYRTSDGRFLNTSQIVEMMGHEFNATESVKGSAYKMTNFSFHGHQAHCTVTTHLVVILTGHQRVANDSTTVVSWTQKNGKWKVDWIVTTVDKRG